MDPGFEIARVMGEITRERDMDHYRAMYGASMRVLREIPSGTPDSELTAAQRKAWRDHDRALQWMQTTPIGG